MTARLRLLRPDDAEAVFGLLSNLEIIRWMKFPVFSRQDAETYCRELQPAVIGPGRYTHDRVICAEGEDRAIGLCGLVVDAERAEAEAWYLLDPAYWGKGLAVNALCQLLEFAFTTCELRRVWACCVTANRRSARVLEKAGLRCEGEGKQTLLIRGEWFDGYTFALLASEWNR